MKFLRVSILVAAVAAVLVAALLPVDEASAQRAFRAQEPIMVTATATDTTITFDYPGHMQQVYPYDADLWISYTPGCSNPIKIPAETGYTIQAYVTSLTLHRSVSATSALVTPVKE